MARSRNIKPSIMDNEELAEMPPLHRLLFIYLWMLADREGRIEDRPKRIAQQALGYDRDANVDSMLNKLAGAGFIERYEVDGIHCIQVTNFLKHQSPHGTEKDSSLPDKKGGITVHKRGKHGYAIVGQQNDNSVLTVKELSHNALIPDSGFLIPDSLIPEEEAKASLSPSKLPDCPHVEIINLFAEKLPMLPQPKAELWDGQRAKNLRARWTWVLTAKKSKGENTGQPYATDKASALAWFSRYFAYVADQCPHLTGNNDRAWTADLAWLVKSDNFGKVLQGNYQRETA